MAARELSLFADLDQGRLVTGFNSTLQATLPRFVFGDSIPVSFRALKSATSGANPWREVDLTGKTVRIAIGTPAGAASSGTFTLTYGGDTTAAIAYDATGATIAAALNALASIIAAGGVSVTKAATGVFRIIFDDVGSRTAITADTSSIYPSSGAEIRVAVEGDGSTREIVVARIENSPAAYAELSDNLPDAAVTITETRTGSGSVGAINSLEFTVIPYSGFYVLEIGAEQTLGIPWDADAATIEAALELLSTVGDGLVSVTGEYPVFAMSFDVTLGDIGAVTADLTGLVVPTGRAGELNLNTAEMVELLNGAAQASAKLEVELYDIADSTTWTVLQVDCTVIDDVIGNSPATSPAFPSVLEVAAPGTTAPVNAVVASLSVSGTLTSNGSTPVTFGPDIPESAVSNGKMAYYDPGDGNSAEWDGTKWIIIHQGSSAEWHSSEDVETPDLVVTWTPQGAATGSPVVAMNAATPATATPPYFRVHGGFLYAQEAGVWKKTALSAL